MFDDFLNFFGLEGKLYYTDDPYLDFMCQLGGYRFGNGLFTAFSADNIDKWMEIVTYIYPAFKNKFKLFGYSWMGNCFGIDLRKKTYGNVLLFEIGTGYVLEIPCSFTEFLNQEIPNYADACLAKNFFDEWMLRSQKEIKDGNCVGYQIPLFVGGKDNVENLEESDMEVYWFVVGRVMKQVDK